jgi:hypothetical protein
MIVGDWFVKSFIDSEQADFKVLEDNFYFKQKNLLVGESKISKWLRNSRCPPNHKMF